MKRFFSLLMSLVMAMSLCLCFGAPVSAASATVTMPYSSVTVPKGKAITLKPTVKGVSSYSLVWSTSDKTVASVAAGGKVTGLKNGSATITVKVKGTNASASVKVYVGKRVTSITLSDNSITLKKGGTYTLTRKVNPSDAAYKGVSYSSSNKKVATINSRGVITGVGNGTAKITVKALDGSGTKAVITVKVGSTSSSTQKAEEAPMLYPTKKDEEDKAPASAQSDEPTTGGFDKNKSSAQIVKEMKVGWNLGNSLDALGGAGLTSETAWGNPKTTEKMILDIKKMGFNTVRIPVSWGQHADSKGNVDSKWMARVKEVVDYAYNNGMYVILNSHHDNAYYDIGGCVLNDDVYAASKSKMANVWKQIANTFKDYDERLVFETLNEPRTEGSAKEWSGGTAQEREIVYGLNEAIVKSIRSTGGNNKYRHIMVPSYAATASTNILRGMKLPDDDRIIVSVHAYTPYFFAMAENGSSEFSDSDKRELDRLFADLNSIFVSKGTPVVIGEFGATNKKNLIDRCDWADYYVRGAKKYGIACVVWDNNSNKEYSGAECFGLYDRGAGEWSFPEVAESMVSAAK